MPEGVGSAIHARLLRILLDDLLHTPSAEFAIPRGLEEPSVGCSPQPLPYLPRQCLTPWGGDICGAELVAIRTPLGVESRPE
jgi:hypothetical protein